MKNPPIEANGETLDFLSLIVSGLISLSNPHTVFFDSSTHGYNTAEVNRLAMICAMKVVGTILRETAQLRTLKRFVVPRDSNSPLPF